MAGYKIQLKDKNGNKQYPVSTTEVVVDADGVSVADLLDRKQPTLVSGVNIKTINGKTLLGEGDLVIEGGNGDGSASVETRVLYVYLEGAELTEEEKTYNKETYDKIANGENVQLVFDVLGIPITHAFYDGVLVFTCSVVVIEGSALYAQGRLFSDGNYEYEEGVIGSNSYPIYYSHDGTPLTEEQKAANKMAVDRYAENESITLYPYNSSVGHPFDVVLTLSEGIWKMAELTNYIFASFNDDGTAMYYVKVTVNQDGDVQVEFSAQSPLVLASKAYVDSKVGGSSEDGGLKYFVERYVYEGKTEEERTYNLESLAMAEQGVDILWAGLGGAQPNYEGAMWHARYEIGHFAYNATAEINAETGVLEMHNATFVRDFYLGNVYKEYVKAFFAEEQCIYERAFYQGQPIISWFEETDTTVRAYFIANGLVYSYVLINIETGEVSEPVIVQ